MVALLILFGLSFNSKAADIINAKKQFEVSIKTPSVMTDCLNKIWVYSKQEQNVSVFTKSEGRKLTEIAFTDQVSAMTCFKSQLAVAGNSVGVKIYELDGQIKLKLKNNFKLPAKGIVTDLQCHLYNCYIVIAGTVFKTQDFKHWVQVKMRTFDNIPHKDIDTSTNPFDDWQEKLLITKGKITKVAILGSNHIALLDPFRANILINNKDQWTRWGNWGTWEGRFLAPKSFAVSDNNIIFVSDPHLKAISAFFFDGSYLGMIGENSNLLDVHYPTQIYYSDNTLFIIDFFSNKFSAFELNTYEIQKAHLNDASTGQFRNNLFRRPEVMQNREKNKCLLCHDGTMRDDTIKYFESHRQHPVKTTCTECHDAHHVKILKKPQQQLCLSCHADHVKVGHKADKCTDCHSSHNGVEKTLKKSLPELCINCHKFKSFEHRTTEHMLNLESAGKIKFVNNKISCTTCHVMHGQKINPQNILPFCANCHGDKSEVLFKKFHKGWAHK